MSRSHAPKILLLPSRCFLAMLTLMFFGCRSESSETTSATPRTQSPAPPETPVQAQVDPPAAPGAMAPSLTIHDGTVVATWLEPAVVSEAAKPGAAETKSRPAYQVRTSTLRDEQWSSPVTVSAGAGIFANWADVPIVGTARDGAQVVSWASISGPGPYSYGVALARSTNKGASWRQLGVAHSDRSQTEHGFVSMAPDGSGVRAFWLDGREMATGHGEIKGKSKNPGAMNLRTAIIGDTVRHEQLLDDRVCDCCATAAAQTANGPVVVYRNRTREEIRDIWIVRATKTGWSKPRPVHRDGWKISGCPVNGPAIAASRNDLVVAWYTYAADRPTVRVAFSADGGASFSDPIEVDGPLGRRAPMGRVDVQLLAKGEAVVSWMTSEREQASLRLRRVAAKGLVGDDHVVATTRAGRSAGFPRIGRMAESLVVMWTQVADVGETSALRAIKLPIALVPEATSSPEDRARVAALHAGPQPGDQLPAISATTLSGSKTTLSSLRGSPVLLNIWATWCEPCRRELPALNKLAARLGPQGLRVVGLSVDQDSSRADLERFTKRRKISYPIWHDADDTASSALGVGILPATYVIDRDGRLLWRHSGAVTAADPDLIAALERAIGD